MNPRSLRKVMLEYFHDDPLTGKHLKTYRAFRKIIRRYIYNTLINDGKDFLITCDVCQRVKERNKLIMGTLGSKVISRVNWNWMDVVIILLPSNQQCNFILICVDHACYAREILKNKCEEYL